MADKKSEALRENRRETAEQIQQELSQRQRNAKNLSTLNKELTNDEIYEKFRKEKENDKKLHEMRLSQLEAEGKVLEAAWDKAGETASAFIGSTAQALTNKLDSVIKSYSDTIQKISGGLIGVGGKGALNTLTDKLQETLSTSSLVRQENVYNNLAKLVHEGIVGNVQQRAFLETLAEDIDLVFNGTNASLNRLINLYQTDITAERLAIEYNLKEFLNSNYKTSQYITQAFQNISDSLTEVIALNGNNMGLESTIQTWLGSYYSAGFSQNTVTGLADALNALGTGDISKIGSGISNLVLMGVARAGLDYGDLLNNSISQSDVELIMTEIASYIGDLSGQSNVVKSQMASIFGFNVADIIAAQNSGLGTAGLGVSTNIGNMLNNYETLVPTVTKIQNTLENIMYSWGTNIAGNSASYMTYEATKLISGLASDFIGAAEIPQAKIAANYIRLAPAVMALALGGLTGGIGDIVSSLKVGSSGLSGIYEALGGTLSSGSFVMSGSGVSGSMAYSNTSTNSLLEGTKSSIGSTAGVTYENEKSTGDYLLTIDENVLNIYNYLDQKLQTTITNAIAVSSSSSSSDSYTTRSSNFGG